MANHWNSSKYEANIDLNSNSIREENKERRWLPYTPEGRTHAVTFLTSLWHLLEANSHVPGTTAGFLLSLFFAELDSLIDLWTPGSGLGEGLVYKQNPPIFFKKFSKIQQALQSRNTVLLNMHAQFTSWTGLGSTCWAKTRRAWTRDAAADRCGESQIR